MSFKFLLGKQDLYKGSKYWLVGDCFDKITDTFSIKTSKVKFFFSALPFPYNAGFEYICVNTHCSTFPHTSVLSRE
ncbi:MAG: hypothetical protein EAZ92_00705 [Candidatus Kapaibacterium sp.]|nr:MAG: hypothetical protein EAZ92_00705 [Candidatus Kapabacteria bacterium]